VWTNKDYDEKSGERKDVPPPIVHELFIRFKNLNEIKLVVDQSGKRTPPKFIFIHDGATYYRFMLDGSDKPV
jgi:hypothetical protein